MNSMQLQDLLLEQGDNVLFMIKARPLQSVLGVNFTSSNDQELTVPAKLIQRRYEVKDGYKVELEPTLPGFGIETYYMTDLASLIRKGQVQVFVPAQANELA